MNAKTIKGMAVVALQTGEKIGSVDDVLFDPNQGRIAAFKVNSGSLLKSSTHMLDFGDIHNLGADAIMVTDGSMLRGDPSGNRYSQFPGLDTLGTLRVVSTEGAVVGSLDAVRIDPATGTITDLEIGQGGLLGALRSHNVVPASQVVSMGRDVVVIRQTPSGAAETPGDPQQPGPPDGATPGH